LIRAGTKQQIWIADQNIKHNSPLVQLFLDPFGPPVLVLSDFREAQDIMLRRSSEWGKAVITREIFGGVLPNAHIVMKSADPRFKLNKELVRDLMTPAFLNEVSKILVTRSPLFQFLCRPLLK